MSNNQVVTYNARDLEPGDAMVEVQGTISETVLKQLAEFVAAGIAAEGHDMALITLTVSVKGTRIIRPVPSKKAAQVYDGGAQ